VLPRSIKLESSSVSAQVSRIIGGVVRQTLMAFAAAAAADGSGASDGSGGGGAMVGYLFRECVGEMKYLLAFHSPKVGGARCLIPMTTCMSALPVHLPPGLQCLPACQHCLHIWHLGYNACLLVSTACTFGIRTRTLACMSALPAHMASGL
jgi:hypothetical protein